MALVKCADCGNQMSSEALACGNQMSSEALACARCGRPAAKPRPNLGAQVFALAFLGLIGWGCWTFYRSLTGADLVGVRCTMQLGAEAAGGPDVPLFPTADEATRSYGAGLMGKATESYFARAKWMTSGTTATIQERAGSAYRVTTIRGDTGWIASNLCQR